jgi:SLT domain-containing protein
MAGYADEIIRLILTARDDTAAAFASATNNQKEYNRLQEESGRVAEESGKKSRERANEVVGASRREKEALESVNKTRSEGLRESTSATQKQVDALVKLERAERNAIRANQDTTRSFAEQRQATLDSVNAQRRYQETLTEGARTRVSLAKQALQAEKEASNSSAQRIKNAERELNASAEALRLAERRAEVDARTQSARVAAAEREARAEQDRQTALKETAELQEHLAARENARIDEEAERRTESLRRRVEESRRAYQSEISLSEQRSAAIIDGIRKEDEARKSLALQRAQSDRNFVIGSSGVEQAQERLNRKTAEYARQIDKVAQARQKVDRLSVTNALGKDAAQKDYDVARGKAAGLASDINEITRTEVIEYDADTGKAEKKLLSFEAAKEAAGRDVKVNVDVDTSSAIAQMTAFGSVAGAASGKTDSFGRAAQRASTNIATFDNFLRGLMSLGIVVFLNQIVVVAGAAVGSLTSLAGAAVYAGGALGGSLTAGAAQAIPVLGVLAAAFSRVKAVIDAGKQSQLLQQQMFANQGKDAKKAADNTDAVINAQDALSASQKRAVDAANGIRTAQMKVGDATKGVTEARKEAIKSLEDLILKERQAQLAAEGANLSLAESQDALRDALASGDTGAIARRRLDVKEASLGVDDAQINRNRASADLALRRKQGVSGTPGVVQANRALSDARQGVKDAVSSAADAGDAVEKARRALEKAKRTGADAGTEQSAAAGKLNFLLSNLSDSERALYDSVERIKKVFADVGKDITDPIIDSATHAVDGMTELLRDPTIIAAAADLSKSLSSQLDKTFDHFTDASHVGQLKFFAGEAEANLEPVGEIIRNLGDAFLNVAQAASPALAELLDYIDDGTDKLKKFTESAEGQDKMANFFSAGVQDLKTFVALIDALGSLMAGVFGQGGGADAGASAVERLTATIERLDDKVRTVEGRTWLKNFFQNSTDVLAALEPLIVNIARNFSEIFTPESVRNVAAFSDIVGTILVPALSAFLNIAGDVSRTIEALFNIPIFGSGAKSIISWGIALTLVMGIFSKFRAALAPIGVGVKGIGASLTASANTSNAAWARLIRTMSVAVGLANTPIRTGGNPGGYTGPAGARPVPATGPVQGPTRGGIPVQAVQPYTAAERAAAQEASRSRTQRAGGALRNFGNRLGSSRIGLGGAAFGAAATVGSIANSQAPSTQNISVGALSGAAAGLGLGIPGVIGGALIGGIGAGIVGMFRKNKKEEAAKKAEEAAAAFAKAVADGTRRGMDVGLSQSAASAYGRLDANRTRNSDKLDDAKTDFRGLAVERENARTALRQAQTRLRNNPNDTLAASDVRQAKNRFDDLNKAVGEARIQIKKMGDQAERASRSQGDIVAGSLRRRVRRADSIDADEFINPVAGFKGNARETRAFAGSVSAEALRANREGKLSDKEYRDYVKQVNKVLGGIHAPKITDEAAKELKGEKIVSTYEKIVRPLQTAFGQVSKSADGSVQNAARATSKLYARLSEQAVTGTDKQRADARKALRKLNDVYGDQLTTLADSNDPKVRKLARSLQRLRTDIDDARESGRRPIQIEFRSNIDKFTTGIDKMLGSFFGGAGTSAATTSGHSRGQGRATGGYIDGNPAEGDSVPVWVKPGEVILNAHQQMLAGRDAIFNALRATNAPMTVKRGAGYATGVGGGAGGPGAVQKGGGSEGKLIIDFSAALIIISSFGKAAVNSWDKIWDNITKRTRTGRNDIDDTMQSLVRRVDSSQDKIGARLVNGWKNINDEVGNQTSRFRRSISNSMDSVKSSVYDGMKYISDAATESLDAFDVKGPKISISAPKSAKRAATGFIGNPGERGEDAIPIWVGRGEAVLNAAHQRIVNSALYEKGIDGLNGLFRSNRGYHAGNDQSGIGGRGFASGGFTGPNGSGAGFGPVSAFAKKKFGLTMTAGRTDHSLMTASGNVSDHSKGWAGDFSNGVLTPQEDAYSSFWKNKAPQTIKQLIWRNKDQFKGFPIGGHEDHVHVALQPQYAMDASRMAKILSRLSKGLSIDALLASNAGGGTAPDIDHVEMPKVKGTPGYMKDLVKKILQKIRGGANKFIDDKAETSGSFEGGPENDLQGKGGPAPPGQIRDWLTKALKITDHYSAGNLSGLYRMVIGESGGDPNARQGIIDINSSNGSGGALGLLQTIRATFDAYKLPGHNNIFNPVDNAIASIRYQFARYGHIVGHAGYATGGFAGDKKGGDSQSGLAGIMQKMGYPAFATGGIVPGGKGSPQPIVAHAGEWVVNEGQQNRLAGLLGTTADRIKGILGFTGGPTSFAGGGEVGQTGIAASVFARRRRTAMKDGKYEDLDSLYAIPEGDYAGATAEFRVGAAAITGAAKKLAESLKKAAKKLKKDEIGDAIDAVNKAMEENTREGGLLDQLDTAIATRIETSARKLQTKLYGIITSTKDGAKKLRGIINGDIVTTTMTDDELAEREIGQARAALADYNRQARRITRNISQTNQTIKRINEVIKKQLDGRSDEGVEGKLARLEAIKKPTDANKDDIKRLKKDLDSVKDLREDKADAQANLNNLRKRGEVARKSINDTVADIAEKQMAQAQARVQKVMDAARSRGGRTATQLERAARGEAARGNVGGAAAIEDDRITYLKDAAAAAKKALSIVPKGKNYDDLRKETAEAAAEADTVLEEAMQARISTKIEAISNASATAITNADRGNGFADILDRIGGDGSVMARAMGTGIGAAALLGRGAAALRATALEQKGSALQTERAGYAGMMNEAVVAGNVGAVENLTQKIADLDLSIAENVIAIKDNTTASRQVEIDRITNRSGFLTGVYSGLAGISAGVATNTKTPDDSRQAEQLNATRNIIGQTMSGLSQKLSDLTNGVVNTGGLSGNALVDYLKGINFDAIEGGMTTADKEQFESLINGMISNGSALEDNTAALDALKGALSPQSFSSSAWSQFRNAIFNGMGDVLPQYATVPSFDTGGPVVSTGMAKLHKGEYVVTAGKGGTDDGRYTSYNEAPINVEINEAGGPVDVTHLTARLAWEKRRNRGNR